MWSLHPSADPFSKVMVGQIIILLAYLQFTIKEPSSQQVGNEKIKELVKSETGQMVE